MFDERALQGMKRVAVGHAFDGGDVGVLRLGPEDETGTDEPPVHGDGTGPAIAGAAAFLGASQAKTIAQHIQ